MKSAVILFSGGLDSTTCLALARSQGFECYTLSFDYGQKNIIELKIAADLSVQYNVKKHQVFRLSLDEIGGSYITDRQISVPDHMDNENKSSSSYVPGRNSLFLSAAFSFAEVINVDAIFMGLSIVDPPTYPDATIEYLTAFQNMANIATNRNHQNQISILTPLLYLDKSKIIELGYSLGVDFSKTLSCYRPSWSGEACGTCLSCILRKEGFKKANLPDTTIYYKS